MNINDKQKATPRAEVDLQNRTLYFKQYASILGMINLIPFNLL